MSEQLHKRVTLAPKKSTVEWMDIIRFLVGKECIGIRMKSCISCGFGKLYDKQGKEIKVSRYSTLESVKKIVNTIKSQE